MAERRPVSAALRSAQAPKNNGVCRMSLQLALETKAALLPLMTDERAVQSPVFHVIRRNNTVSAFDPAKIAVAMTKAFLAVEGNSAAASRRVHEIVEELSRQVVQALTRRVESERALHIEDIQDQVELAL